MKLKRPPLRLRTQIFLTAWYSVWALILAGLLARPGAILLFQMVMLIGAAGFLISGLVEGRAWFYWSQLPTDILRSNETELSYRWRRRALLNSQLSSLNPQLS